MTNHQLGLVGGIVLAVIHAIWSLLVAIMPAQIEQVMLWVLDIHHLSVPISVNPFMFSKAVILVIFTFVVGYILGWLVGVIRAAIRK